MSEIVFTPDEEFDAFQPEDESIDLVGYVECIEGLKTLRTTQGHVLKFIVHNGSKSRIRVLVWGSTLAMHYEETIKLNSIVQITGGSLRSANTHFRQPNDKTSTLECNVQAHSTLTIHGQYDITDQSVVDESYQQIQLDDVMICNGNIEIQCFIKNEFVQVQTPSTSFGQGVVVDGHYRLTVHIIKYEPSTLLSKGVHIKLRGVMNKRVGGYLKVMSMDHITIVNETIMSPIDLRKSIHSVLLVRTKRKQSDDQVNSSKKMELISQPMVNDLIKPLPQLLRKLKEDNIVKIRLNKSSESIRSVTPVEKDDEEEVTPTPELLRKLKEQNMKLKKLKSMSPSNRRAAMLDIANSSMSSDNSDGEKTSDHGDTEKNNDSSGDDLASNDGDTDKDNDNDSSEDEVDNESNCHTVAKKK